MKKEKSCGCIIFDDGKVLLVEQNNGVCGFPKGHVENNETEIETAKREVKEETNLDVKIDENKRYVMNYVTDRGNDKEVVLFLAKKIGGNLIKQDEEINKAEWVNIDDVVDKLNYHNTKELFSKIIEENKL